MFTAIRNGWKTLRFRHPSIVATASGNTIDYHTPSPSQLEQWTEESLIFVDDESSPDDVIARLTPHRFATLYYLKQDSSVILNLSHWRTDGIGAFHLLNAYFQAVLDSLYQSPLDLPWSEEPARLTPSVEEALNLPTSLTPDIERGAQQYLSTLAYNKGALPAPYKSSPSIIPKGTRSARLHFSPSTTKALQTQCEHLNLHLESAIHAALTASAYAIAPPGEPTHHSSTMRHSLRPHLPEPYNGDAGAAGLYTAGYLVKVSASQSWVDNARHYDAEYRAGATADLLRSRRQYARVMKDVLRTMAPPGPPPSGLDISYVPDVQSLVRPVYENAEGERVEVREVGIGVDVVSRHLCVFVWVFGGKLECRGVYNEAFYEEEVVERMLGLLRENLVANLLSGSSTSQGAL
ncbi:MAG: hypothetical protein OHK93_007355 [Ramalina farinacea]|uniref:Acyltransferase n=1 Tax=Ramalina farinacea TaxID=258253 RepID=A0AA43QN67_9LECA|nr:hypothetical protein [Ramalina farinacea]